MALLCVTIMACDPPDRSTPDYSTPAPLQLQSKVLYDANGLGIGELFLQWRSDADAAYQVLVASSPEVLADNIGDIWDSGKRFDRSPEGIPYHGPSIQPRSFAWWKVRTWQNDTLVSQYSKAQQLPAPERPEGERVVLLGGTLISEMEKHGFFEADVTIRWPYQNITFRNIGWPGDDVFGLARSQFGSAQNTRSWQPPTPEEGFGSKVLMEHVIDADPTVTIVGYGSEVALSSHPEALALFESGYTRLLDFLDSLGTRVALMTPHPRMAGPAVGTEAATSDRLADVASIIRSAAERRDLALIDLMSQIPAPPKGSNGSLYLSETEHLELARTMTASLGLTSSVDMQVSIDRDRRQTLADNSTVTNLLETVHGYRFDLRPDHVTTRGVLHLPDVQLVKLNDRPWVTWPDSASIIWNQDSSQYESLRETIRQKNRFYRYKLRPLNEAYIFLFRRHEMGHLAYEIEEYGSLIAEKEEHIARLKMPITRRIEVELKRPWKSPRDYPEDEVPAYIPKPDIAQELDAFTLPAGFEMNLFAADPMIANPININWDQRGRAWVATSSTYPHIVPGREPNDKIIILEDTDRDGQADKSTVFAENLLVPHSVMPVAGGAYVASTTEFLFLPDHDGDDIADGRQVIFAGFGNADVHHTLHGLRWAPWGDLYMTQSIYINSFIDTPHGFRRLNGSGVWQFRPQTHQLEVFSRGLINPWGFAFDEWGQAFATDGAGSSGINYLFPESAHATAVGAPKVLPGLNQGTPKNTAAEVVYSRHLPSSWQGSVITSDFRANRTVRYALTEQGSGYRSEEVETIVHSSHRSYRPVDSKIGPDGALYIVDWYNPIIDHGEVDFHHPLRDKTHGRIWRMTNRRNPLVHTPDLTPLTDRQLLELLKSPEQFTRMQANRTLVQRGCPPELLDQWLQQLNRRHPRVEQYRVEALWLGAALGHLDRSLLTELLRSPKHQARAAALRMVGHWAWQEDLEEQLSVLVLDPHPQVRLEAVHALRSWGTLDACNLLVKALDLPRDENLDYALWFGLRSLKNVWMDPLADGREVFAGQADHQAEALLAVEDTIAVSLLSSLMAQTPLSDTLHRQAQLMMAKLGDEHMLQQLLDDAIANQDLTILAAMADAPEEHLAKPADLAGMQDLLRSTEPDIRRQATRLAGRWKAKELLPLLIEGLQAEDMSARERMALANALWEIDPEKCRQIATKPGTQGARAAAGIAWARNEPVPAAATVAKILPDLDTVSYAEAFMRAYSRREEGPPALAEALQGVQLSPELAIRCVQVLQGRGLDLSVLIEAIRSAGSLQAIGTQISEADKQAILQAVETEGDAGRGRVIYRRPALLCATCHQIDGFGGKIGPDLSTVGAYMAPNSLLESLLDPSQDVKQGYETVVLTKKDGTLISGTLHRKADDATMIRMVSGEIVSVPSAQIDHMDVSPVSLMPVGLTHSLRQDELVDLVRYLVELGAETSD